MVRKVNKLFEQFQPTEYLLVLKPDEKSMAFSGKVVITGQKIGRPSQRITLHQSGLKIINAKVTKNDKTGSRNLTVERINNQNTFDEVRLHTKEMVYPGLYELELAFEGRFTPKLRGLCSKILKHNADTTINLATEFGDYQTRAIFPCIDEPEAENVTLKVEPSTDKKLE